MEKKDVWVAHVPKQYAIVGVFESEDDCLDFLEEYCLRTRYTMSDFDITETTLYVKK